MNALAAMTPSKRLLALAVAATAAAPLVVAATLVPAAAGMGTHRQLGLPSCTWPAFFGIPCITCGMTTSFAHAVRGEWLRAFVTQPAGFLLALLCAIAVVTAGWSALAGQPVHRLLRPLARGRTAIVATVLLVAAWGWKIAAVRGGAS
jgi:hypothetical protein